MTAGYKGGSIGFVRERIRAQGADVEARLLEHLSQEEATTYRTALPISWESAAHGGRILEQAAALLHPRDPHPNQRLGREMAQRDLTGIYKILLKVATIPAVVQQASRLWKTYHQAGRASAGQEPGAKTGWLLVEGYPDLPRGIRENTTGYIAGLIELTRARNPRVEHDESNPQAWRWTVSWD